MELAIIKPVVALVVWTIIVWFWMYATRIPAMQRIDAIEISALVGTTGRTLDDLLPAHVQWKAHNYNHLHEQPTLFYAIAISLALLGAGGEGNALIAWAYVGLRVVHSIVQATFNKVTIRFALFVLASFCLMALTFNAVVAAFRL
jgi:hypothetical protein